ncbi:inorganic phosphate transporter [Jiulongibacter sp. NS-SX5]|uniref:inorganic phosphate transporter n=1 Tax=Jiulongibacter sp. NS-SX5 TaxID=3463854 RepID=UPI004058D561
MFGLETGIFILLALALLAACFFEFINGFHDTANAVATVIYTNSLKPIPAVVYSGILNFLGVMAGGIGVGVSIINLLPVELLIQQDVYQSLAMVFSILFTAIIWNFGTWYYGIPSSSSHTLIGAILGVGLGYALLPENEMGVAAVNWSKVKSVFTGLLMAPVIGFGLAVLLMWLLKTFTKGKMQKEIFDEPDKKGKPPGWIRTILISTCGLVSFAHGNNDGQKGIGLIMLILIGVVPSLFAISEKTQLSDVGPMILETQSIVSKIDDEELSKLDKRNLADVNDRLAYLLGVDEVTKENKLEIRKSVVLISKELKELVSKEEVNLSAEDKSRLKDLILTEEKGIRKLIDFAPYWIKLMISLSLGFGTMVGWRRIVVTVGEKIGKTHLTYAQGASAELVAASTVGLASGFGLPVSTTHTLSSGIAGTMVASNGIDNLQGSTIKNIALTWVLTLPVSVILSAGLFLLSRWLIS